MESKIHRIEQFIESLPEAESSEDIQYTLLPTAMNFVGGDNGGDCINELYEQCKDATNGGACENYNSACPKSKNKGSCFSTTHKRIPQPVDPPKAQG